MAEGSEFEPPCTRLVCLVSRRDLLDLSEPATKRVDDIVRGPFVVAFEDTSLQEANDLMARAGTGQISQW